MRRYRIACGTETRRLAPRAEGGDHEGPLGAASFFTSPVLIAVPLFLVWGIRAVRSKLQSWKVVLDDIQKALK